MTVVAKTTQTITFGPLPNKVYGSGQITLTATSDSGLPVAYTVSGSGATVSGSTLTLGGVGIVIVTASQAGNGSYMAATSVMQSFNVTPAPGLTLTANNQSRQFGQANPTLTYTVAGFVNGDTQAIATTGAPSLTTTATTSSSTGSYPITIGVGTFSAPNYGAPTFVNGNLIVSGNVAQTITFPAFSNVAYGTGTINLGATASSSLPITYTVTGPASVSGSVLTITGVGTVTVTANQPGDNNYAAATAVGRSFIVTQATLTVTATSQSVTVGSPIPALTYTNCRLHRYRHAGYSDNRRSLNLDNGELQLWALGHIPSQSPKAR